jgi:hypothetical protein
MTGKMPKIYNGLIHHGFNGTLLAITKLCFPILLKYL